MEEILTDSAPEVDSSLISFLTPFQFQNITLSIQPESGKPTPSVPAGGSWFSAISRVRAIPMSRFYFPAVQTELQGLNAAGWAIYFMINEGDGKAVDSTLNCGKRENVIKLKTLAIDSDSADISALIEALKIRKLPPHLVVNSSPGKYHLYFLIEDEDSTPENIMYWESLQKLLSSLVPGLDSSVSKTCQLLRLPGFFHQKAASFRVRVEANKAAKFPKYNLKQLYDRLEAYKFNDIIIGNNGTYIRPKFEMPSGFVPEGQRHDFLLRYINHLAENHVHLDAPEEVYLFNIEGVINRYFAPQHRKDFLEGSRHQEIVKAVADVKRKRLKAIHAQEALAAQKLFKEVEELREEFLPDSFYLNFPGDLGLLTREAKHQFPNLSVELCFAAALAVSGALKADLFRLKNAWPFVNGFVLAPTGAGKSTVKRIVETIADAAGIGGRYSQVIEHAISVQALHWELIKAGGVGTVIIDEAGDYFGALHQKTAPSYMKLIKAYLKNATSSATKEGSRLSPGKSKSNKDTVIRGGMLSVWAFMQPSMFYSSIDFSSMSDGFIPRFFVFKGESKYDYTSYVEGRSGTQLEISNDVRVLIESLNSIRGTIDYDEVEKRVKEYCKNNKIRAAGDIEKRLVEEVFQLKYESRVMNFRNVELTEEAEKRVLEFLTNESKKTIAIRARLGEGSAEEALMVRTEEMLLRLMCNAALWVPAEDRAVVDIRIAEQCIKFYRFQRERFLNKEVKQLSKGYGEKTQDALYAAIVKGYSKFGRPLQLKEITPLIRADNRPADMQKAMKMLMDTGRVWMDYRPHQKFSNRKIAIYMPAVTEDLVEAEDEAGG